VTFKTGNNGLEVSMDQDFITLHSGSIGIMAWALFK
jgi:hypothetical protein